MSTLGDQVAAANQKLQADAKAASSTKAMGKAVAAWVKAADPVVFPAVPPPSPSPNPPPPVPPPPVPAPSTAQIGVYGWGGSDGVAHITAFDSFIGKRVPIAADFNAGDNWTTVEASGYPLDAWEGKGRQLVLGVPLPGGTASLAGLARGDFDSHFAALAGNIKRRNLLDTIVRPMWEFSHSQPWSVHTAADAANFAAGFARIVTAMRAVVPTLTFVWNPEWGWAAVPQEASYPGDAYVDYVGFDIYGQTWKLNPPFPANIGQIAWDDAISTNEHPIGWFAAFAKAHGKKLCIPEWGLNIRDDGHGTGDDVYFIDQFSAWMKANGVAFHVYFDVDPAGEKHQISPPATAFPLGSARFKARFG